MDKFKVGDRIRSRRYVFFVTGYTHKVGQINIVHSGDIDYYNDPLNSDNYDLLEEDFDNKPLERVIFDTLHMTLFSRMNQEKTDELWNTITSERRAAYIKIKNIIQTKMNYHRFEIAHKILTTLEKSIKNII